MPLPIDSMTIQDYCLEAKTLLREEKHADFVNMMLCGILKGKQVVIDAIIDAVDPYEVITGSRDFDSVIGISKDIRVTAPLTMHPVPKRDDTLTRDIHLKYHFTTSEGEIFLPIHKVPNSCLAKYDTHHKVLVLFPSLYCEDRSPHLTQDEMRTFYEQGLRPAIVSLSPDTASEWPATYDDEMFRARGPNGQLSFCTKIVAQWLVPELGDAIRQSLEAKGCSWGAGLVFLHQVRGVKHSSTHSLDLRCAEEALEIFLKDNKLDARGPEGDDDEGSGDKWWIDVGVEAISDFDQCLAWRTDGHTHIVERALRISSDAAARITKPGSSLYCRDLVSHLTAVSGCRIRPGAAHGRYNVSYMQLYNTDKALIYRPDGTAHGKYIKATEILAGKGPKFVENLVQLYNNAIETCSSHARIEVRVPLEEGHRVLLNIDNDLIRQSLVSINPKVWWTLRSLRATAIRFTIEWQSQGPPSARSRPSALLLTAASSVMLSSLHSTIDNGQSTRELLGLVLPHVRRAGAEPDILAFGSARHEDDEDEDILTGSDLSTDSEDDAAVDGIAHVVKRRGPGTLPANPYGMVFLRQIRIGPDHPVPRFDEAGGATVLTRSANMYFFNEPDFESICESMIDATISAPANKNRVKNKTRRAAPYHVPGQAPTKPLFKLKARGARIPPLPRDHGSDIEAEREEQEGDETDIDKTATDLWNMFNVDITETSPNYKGSTNSSYTKLTNEQRLMVNEETYKNAKLSEYFHDCQLKYASFEEWDRLFDTLFPDKFQPPRGAKSQNYFKTQYFPKWEELKQRMDAQSHEQMRRALKHRFEGLYWMPAAVKDRIWWTKIDHRMHKISGIRRDLPSPRILINSSPAKPAQW